MYKQYKQTVSILVCIVLLGASCGTSSTPATEQTVSSEPTVKVETPLPIQSFTNTLPENHPKDIPLFTGVEEVDVHVDTTHKDNYFYTTDASMGEVMAFFSRELPNAKRIVNGKESITYDVIKNGVRTTVFISSTKPSVFPAELTEGKTFVQVLYNQQLLPTIDEFLAQ